MPTQTLDADKNQLRQSMMRMLESVSAHDALAAGEAISVRMASWSNWRSTSVIALFATITGEVDTRPLFERAWREGKQLLLPRMLESRTLEFAVVDDIGSLHPGRYGVLEPGRRCPALPVPSDAIIFVPGRAFDRAGGRLGRGAGYYDRALAACVTRSGRPRFIGLGFERQIVPSVPMNPLDMRMDGLMTERDFFELE